MFIGCLILPGIGDPTVKEREFSIKRELWKEVMILL